MIYPLSSLKTFAAILVALSLLAAWFAFTINPVHALSCIVPGTPAEELANADAVLYGEVIDVQGTKPNVGAPSFNLATPATTTIRVKEWFKGDLGNEVTIKLDAYAYWYNIPTVGQEAVLYLTLPQKPNDSISMPLCGRSTFGNVTNEVKELRAATGITIPPTPTPPKMCHTYGVTSGVVQGYGLAHNPRTMELTLKASCDTDGVEVSTHPGVSGLTYKHGYYYITGSWKRFTYDGSLLGGNWVEGNAAHRLAKTIAAPGTEIYFVAYTCDLDGSGWKCGCADRTCSTSHWQLQRIEVPQTPSLGQTVCTQDVMMCPNGNYVGRTGPKCEFVCN